jgi:hypothetical protein
VKHTSIEAAYEEELNLVMADISATHMILKALPESIISLERRALINAMAGAIQPSPV